MSDKDLIADIYRQQGHMLAAHLADFSEADMLVRPAEMPTTPRGTSGTWPVRSGR